MDREKSSFQAKSLKKLISAKTAIKFFCLFVIIYGLLMAAWPVVGGVYSKFYQAAGGFLFGSFGRGGIVQFSQLEDSTNDVYITALNRYRVDENGNMSGAQLCHSIRYGDYMHIAFLIALIMATPLSLKRKILAIIWGLILMHAIVVFKLVITIFHLFSGELVSLLVLNAFWRGVVFITYQVVVQNITTGFIIAFFVWVLVSFHHQDWIRTVMQKEREK